MVTRTGCLATPRQTAEMIARMIRVDHVLRRVRRQADLRRPARGARPERRRARDPGDGRGRAGASGRLRQPAGRAPGAAHARSLPGLACRGLRAGGGERAAGRAGGDGVYRRGRRGDRAALRWPGVPGPGASAPTRPGCVRRSRNSAPTRRGTARPASPTGPSRAPGYEALSAAVKRKELKHDLAIRPIFHQRTRLAIWLSERI